MSGPRMNCPQCGHVVEAGQRYCSRCGEPVDQALVVGLRALHARLQALDVLVAEGLGDATVADARGRTLQRYLELRRPPSATVAPAKVPTAEEEHEGNAATAGGRVAAREGGPGSLNTGPGEPAEPRGPVFSWRAFVAEQAIAIMAYLGGFLLLVATLSFEVGGWQALSNEVKLAVVCTVYAAFGGLGFALRRAPHLRAVGGAYLAVFALMTPLVALAVYRFALAGLGFSAAGMLCIAAAYASAIYLTLAWRTGFATYGYLGWMALVVTGLSVAPWVGLPREWQVCAATLVAVGLAASEWALCRRTGPPAVSDPARLLAVLAAVIAAMCVEGLGLVLWIGPASPLSGTEGQSLQVGAFASASGALAALALLWSRRLRSWQPPVDESLLDLLDWLAAALAVEATVGIAAWLDVSRETMALLLATLGIVCGGGAAALRTRWSRRVLLRWGIWGLALVLPGIGALLVQDMQPPNAPLIACLTVAVLLAVGCALLERAPWLMAVAGLFLSLDYRAALVAALPPTSATRTPFALDATLILWIAGLATGLSLAALAFGRNTRTRPYAVPVYAVALANAAYATLYLPGQNPLFQTALLCLFVALALAVARIEQWPLEGGAFVALYGVLAVLPGTSDEHGTIVATTMLGAAVAAMTARLALGRQYAAPLYAVALWAGIRGGMSLIDPDMSTAGWSALGLPFATWTLLAVAMLAVAATLLERWPVLMVVPAAFALWATFLTTVAVLRAGQGQGAVFALTLGLAGTGAALRWLRGRWWGAAWQVTALVASILAVLSAEDVGPHANEWRVIELLAFALAAYPIAAQERQPWLTAVAAPYALLAAYLVPGTQTLGPMLALGFGATLVGVGLRIRWGPQWAYATYAVAAGTSWMAVARVPGGDPGLTEALLLAFAATAYLLTVLEQTPLAGIIPLLYTATAIYVQPDAHALLPLALALAACGLVLGRIAGPRWSWPAYGAAAVAAGFTVALGRTVPGFEPLALLGIGLAAYAIAALEARPDVLPLALLLGAAALATGAAALGWQRWQGILAFATLAWIYAASSILWLRLPLAKRPSWAERGAYSVGSLPERWRDPRVAGMDIHVYGGLALAAAASAAAIGSAGAFDVRARATLAAATTLLSLAGLLAGYGAATHTRAPLYVAGEAVAVALTWFCRWLGADTVQALVLAPGSYQILAGALLRGDGRAVRLARLTPFCSAAGAGLLLLPTLGQSIATEPTGVYALVLGLEALAIAGVGVGTRSRLLVLAGTGFVGAAALRGAALAVDSGVPIPLVIAALALLLMGGATWLSLRARHEAGERG